MKNRSVVCLSLVLSLFLASCVRAQELKEAPDFALSDLSGLTVKLSELTKQKKPVLLFFWTTWCPYCLKEMKVLVSSYKKAIEDKGIKLLAINAGEPESDVRRLAVNYQVPFTVLVDDKGKVSDAYRVMGVPTFVLVDKRGKIRFRQNYMSGEELEKISAE
jgi:peroxiredoxin